MSYCFDNKKAIMHRKLLKEKKSGNPEIRVIIIALVKEPCHIHNRPIFFQTKSII